MPQKEHNDMVNIDINLIDEMTSIECQRATVLLLHRVLERLDKLDTAYSAQCAAEDPANDLPPATDA